MLLPDSMELRICVPFNSRSTAWASFDGRGRVELKRACALNILPSNFLMDLSRGRPCQDHRFQVPVPNRLRG